MSSTTRGRRWLAITAAMAITIAVAPGSPAHATAPASGGAGDPAPASISSLPAGTHRPAHLTPFPQDAAAAQAARARGQQAAVAAVQAQAGREPLPAQKTGSYQISPAVRALLGTGLGLPVGSALLTGLKPGRSAGTLQAVLATGPTLTLPADVPAPTFGAATLLVDKASDTLTVTASSTQASLSVRITHASSTTLAAGTDLNSKVTMRVPVLGTNVTVSGPLTYANATVAVSMTGHLPATIVLQPGVATLTKGGTVTVTTGDGLRLAGTADLGPAAHQLPVSVTGRLQRTDAWSLTVGSAPAPTPGLLPGLTLTGAATGTVTDGPGGVHYDVQANVAGTWRPVAGVSLSGASLRLSDTPPSDAEIAAPGIGRDTPWATVTGDVELAAGTAGNVAAHGTLAANLTTGAATLTARQGGTTLPLSAAPARLVLAAAHFGGLLTVGSTGVTGNVTGTGLLTVTPSVGKPSTASASLRMTPAGSLVAAFPVNGSALGVGTPGTPERGYWAATAVTNYPAGSGTTLDLPAGISATTVHGTALPRPASPRTPNVTADTVTGSTTYTLSPAVYAFLTQQLGIPLGPSPTISGTLTGQTLTLSVGAPGPLPLTLPAGVPNPVFGGTTITVDEASNTITLMASATAGVTATLSVTITNAGTATLTGGTDLTATLTLGNVPFIDGTTVTLTGALTYTNGTLGASLAGSLNAALPLAGGAVTLQQGDSLSIATGTGLAIGGTALIGTSANPYTVTVNGTLADLSNWSLSVTNTAGVAWQPLPNLTVYPNFHATITDTAGTIGFDLGSTNAGSWSPGNGATLSFTGFEVSNQTPPDGVSCPAINAGDTWIDLQGTFTYSPSGMAALSAEGCADLTSRDFHIKTTASGSLLPNFSPYFQLTNAALTASNDSGTFTVTASAGASVTVPGGGSVSNLAAAVSIRSDGTLVAGVDLGNLNALNASLSGSGVIYISNAQINNFKPTDYGLPAGLFPSTIPLRAGVNVAYSYTVSSLPSNVTTVLNNLHVTIPSGTTILAVGQVSSSGLDASLDVNFGTGASGAQLFNYNGSAFFLDDVTLGISIGGDTKVSLAGGGYLEMPAMWSGGQPSHANVTASASLDLNTLSPVFSLGLSDWSNAFGVPGLDIKDFVGSFAFSEDPSVSLSADQITLPTGWPQAIGLAAGAQISLDVTISLDQPLINFSITPPAGGGVALTPLAVGYANQIIAGIPLTASQQNVVNSLQISSASFYLAPFGGTTAAGLSIAPGLGISFNATVDHVMVNVEGGVGVSPPSLSVNVSAGSYAIGPVTIGAARFMMNINPTQVKFGFSGGFSYGGNSFTGAVNLALGSTANGASINFNLVAGLPYYLAVNAALQGSVSGDGTGTGGAQLAASAVGGFTVNGHAFGTIRFSLTIPGSLQWSDTADSLSTLVNAFVSAGASYQLIMTALQGLGYSAYDIYNELGIIGSYSGTVLSWLESTFNPFSTEYYDIWTWTSSGQFLVLDVGGGSQAPNAQVDTWTWNNGYNQDWAFVPDPYATGWYEVVNRGSGQCLSDYNNSTSPGSPLVQYPCFGGADQLWYFGNIALNTTYVVTNLQSWLVMDVQNAYPWQGGTMDQWYYNGGSNQQFWLTNSGN